MMKHSSGETQHGEPQKLHVEDLLRGNAVKETQKAGRRSTPQVAVKKEHSKSCTQKRSSGATGRRNHEKLHEELLLKRHREENAQS